MAVLDVARPLTEDESRSFLAMLRLVRRKRERNQLRTSYHDAKKRLDKIGFSIPPHMQDFAVVLGWPNKAVKVPARRVRPDGFTLPRQSTMLAELEEVFGENYFAAVERMAIEASLQHSVSFVFVTPGDTDAGEPEIIVAARTALEATAEIDTRTNRVTKALELVGRWEALLYLPGETLRLQYLRSEWMVTAVYTGVKNRVTCTPYVWGRSLERPFGYSRITRPLMGFTDMAVRTMLRQEVNAEFYGAPQRALLGAEEEHFLDATGKRISPLDALIGGVWALPNTRDEETGDLVKPTLQQLTQATFQPHGEMLKSIGLMVSSETSIPVGYLGIIHDNPSSADAIRANESDLVSVVEAELPSIGMSRVDLARNVLAVKHGEWTPAMEAELRGLSAHFMDPGTTSKAAQADAGLKFTQTFPDGDPEVAMEVYGLDKSKIERMNAYRAKKEGANKLAAMVAAARSSANPVFSAPDQSAGVQ
ncbi:phage portal protein [Pseudarthrobacter sp. NIBRBAC000502770]|uniref:phage portal protein n=1 Tax=Pseudarthrobacter sp. NIBRBAC000502770 TaxID=2590785 RepID=UPI0011404FC9|nr:phage portal protein [Pseudarthrobacter sp. NIBRBAC000502770]QDG90713.1 phage portal protein [Pseudarthrobacter sp. NIBRBAC000502770]